MDLSGTVRGWLLIAVLAMGLVVLAAGCGSEPAAAPEPTPAPELTLDELLQSAGEKMAAIETVKFAMIDENESGAPFFEQKLKTVNGEVRSPDGARLLVDVESAAFGFVQIEIVVVEDQSYIKFSKEAPWLSLPSDQVPFNFGGLGIILSDLLTILEDAAIAGRESVREFQTIRVDGNVTSEDMSGLINSVDSGHAITLSYWFDEADHTVRQFRIDGQLFNDDGPETSRLVELEINVPVDIQLPDTAS